METKENGVVKALRLKRIPKLRYARYTRILAPKN